MRRGGQLLCDNGPQPGGERRIMHGASPTCTAVLGRSLMAASMMGCMMKNAGDEVSLLFKGDGPAGNVVCVGRSDGSVKGYVAHPEVELPPGRTENWMWEARWAARAR